jgi:hypothetical protein
MRFMAIMAGVVVGAAIAAGCGSGDDDPLTKAEFTRQADALCKKNSKEVQVDFNALLKQFQADKNQKSDQEKARAIGEEVILPYYRSKLEDLESLEPPSADEEQVSTMLETLEEGIEEAEKTPDDTLKGFASITEAGQLAKKYGLKACARA